MVRSEPFPATVWLEQYPEALQLVAGFGGAWLAAASGEAGLAQECSVAEELAKNWVEAGQVGCPKEAKQVEYPRAEWRADLPGE